MNPPIALQRYQLPFASVRIEPLDTDQKPIGKCASGFIRRENGRLFVYTCWHIVSGFGIPPKVGLERPRQRFLEVQLQNATFAKAGAVVIGDIQKLIVPLYDEPHGPGKPLWYQDDRHIPHPDLNNVGLYVPFWHDVVKLELPQDLHVSDLQIVDESKTSLFDTIGIGEKCIIVGYPYGYSSLGPDQPSPVGLTRFIAAVRLGGRVMDHLLESPGAGGMSGGPVFLERGDDLIFFGIYTGLIFPDHPLGNERATALGTITDLSMVLQSALPLVKNPSDPA